MVLKKEKKKKGTVGVIHIFIPSCVHSGVHPVINTCYALQVLSFDIEGTIGCSLKRPIDPSGCSIYAYGPWHTTSFFTTRATMRYAIATSYEYTLLQQRVQQI